jgi:hypothetical protein
MQARTGRTATAAALFLCAGAWLSARQARPDQSPAFRSGVEVVTLDVGVVDKQGQPVRGLVPGDFLVNVGGQPRRVVTAEFVDVASVRTDAPTPPDAAAISTNEGVGVGRMFMFIVDQSTLDLGSARQVARSSSRFFTGLTFADRSALALLPVGPNVGFTWVHSRVRDAFQRVIGLGGEARTTWEYGSLAEARDIASANSMALRSLGQRECGSGGSISASAAGEGAPGGAPPGPTASGPAPAPGAGGDAQSGGSG